MILEPSLPFMSFPLEELFETARRSDRFLWKSQLSGESRGSSIPGTGESDRQPSRRVVLGWDYQHVGSRNRQFGNHRAPEIRFGGSIDQGGARMGGQRSWLRGAALIGFVGLAWAPCTWAQSQAGASSLSGFGFMPQSVMGGSTQGGLGVVAVPSFMGVGTQQGTGLGSANAMMMNPLGLNYAYGPAIPMTGAQAGLFMLSTQQRMLGLGNGQISGVRPAGQDPTGRKTGSSLTAAHTRNANIPGGQAARYFNRGTTTASRSQPHFKRQSRYFPQTAQ
jgi:hypothetical protein